jgi:general stress protein YciG
MSARGFGLMTPERRREIARMGGKAANARGTAHKFTPAEARVAGSKGGAVISQDRLYMATIGRRGAASRARGKGASNA